MIGIKNKFTTDKRLVFKNFFNLGIIQALELVLPLLTIPYVVRVIGLDYVGLIAFVTSIVGYFNVLINYGFHLNGTKIVAQNKENLLKLSQLFNDVTYTKIFLSIISFIIFSFCTFFIDKLNQHYILNFLVFFNMIFNVFTPNWFLQGVQDLKIVSILNIILKSISTLCIFIFISKEENYILLVIIPMISSFIILLILHLYVFRKYKIIFLKPNFKAVINQIKEGFFIFMSQLKITFFGNFSTVMIGFVLNNNAVGVFSSAQKIISALSALQVPIVSALYPYFAKNINSNIKLAFYQINKIAKIGGICYLMIIAFIFFFAKDLSTIIFGSQIDDISDIIRILVFTPLLIFINNLFGTQFLLNLGKDRLFFKILVFAALMNILLIYPFLLIFGLKGAAISLLLTEVYICYTMYYFAKKIFINAK